MNADVALMMALPNESKGLFEQAGIEVHYSGIGKINAAFKAFEVIQKTGCKTLINLGSAGSSHFNAHSLVEVTTLCSVIWMYHPWALRSGSRLWMNIYLLRFIHQPILNIYLKVFVVQAIHLKLGFQRFIAI
jgi:hypothetical protein